MSWRDDCSFNDCREHLLAWDIDEHPFLVAEVTIALQLGLAFAAWREERRGD